MLIIRLQRVGRKNDPSFRIVVMESKRAAKSGAFLEILGSYNPRRKDTVAFKRDRILHWINNGAKLSATVNNLLVGAKIIERAKINVVRVPNKIEKKGASALSATTA